MTTPVAPTAGLPAEKSLLTIQKARVRKQLLRAELTEQRTLESKPRRFAKRLTE